MVLELKVRKVGNSLGVVLPKEALSHLGAAEGDILTVTEAADGTLRIAAPQAEKQAQFSEQMKAAESIIERYRNTLRELAK